MPQAFRRDLNFVHLRRSDVIAQTESLAFAGFGPRTAQGLHQLIIAEDIEGLLERLEIVRTHQHERRTPVSGDQDAVC